MTFLCGPPEPTSGDLAVVEQFRAWLEGGPVCSGCLIDLGEPPYIVIASLRWCRPCAELAEELAARSRLKKGVD